MSPSLAQIVVEAELARPHQVVEARHQADRSGEPLVVAIVRHARVDDAALAETLRRRLGLPPAGALDAAEPEALREVPHELARRRRALPLAIDHAADGSRVLHVAMADPTDSDALTELEIATGCRLDARVAALGAVEDAIARAYRGFVTQVMPRDEHGRERRPFGEPPPRSPRSTDAPVVPTTQPFHHIEDELPLELRLRALVELLQHKGLLTDEEWTTALQKLLRERDRG
jgi:hypothetical protein